MIKQLFGPFSNANVDTKIRLHNSHKLVTKEDSTHFHKTLGIICLVHYGYRYYLLFTKGTMNMDNSFACGLMCLHGLLSVSSVIFHIPEKRNKSAPMIYPEYRQHSILFAMRSVICFFLTYYQYSSLYKMTACYATMLLADVVTFRHQSVVVTTTMRDMPFDKRIPEKDQSLIIRMQSSQQIGATLFMFGNLDSCFTPMFSIQIAAFLMTLVRKNIIDSNMWHLLYNTSLLSNIFCYYSLPTSYIISQITLFQLFYYWRFSFDKVSTRVLGNKYVGWTVIFALIYFYEKERNNLHYGAGAYDMVIRRTLIAGYLIIHMYKSKGLLVAFLPKTD